MLSTVSKSKPTPQEYQYLTPHGGRSVCAGTTLLGTPSMGGPKKGGRCMFGTGLSADSKLVIGFEQFLAVLNIFLAIKIVK